MKSIIFILESTLKIVKKGQTVKLLEEIVPINGKYLDLSERFDKIWGDLEDDIKNVNEIYLLLGEKSGFTDSRIVYIWAKGESYFKDKKLFVDFLDDTNLDFENEFNRPILEIKLEKILKTAKTKDTPCLSYSKEANIGKKQINTEI